MDNNILDNTYGGIKANSANDGIVNSFVPTMTNASTCHKNVWITEDNTTQYPTTNPYNCGLPVDADAVGFTDWPNKNYLLTAESTYKAWCDDSSDPGPNIALLNAATANTTTGDWT